MLSKTVTNKTRIKIDAKISLKKNGKSFYWASRFLGRKMSQNATNLYAFCRVLDDMADGDIEDGPIRLSQIEKQIRDQTNISDPLLEEFLPFFKQMKLPERALGDLIEGLLMDQTDVYIQNEAELIQYSYHVAGTVGWMMCAILECRDKKAFAFALDLGIAMQLTNIARDVYEDASMGRRYLPADWVDNISPSEILEASRDPNSKNIELIKLAILKLLDLADLYYQSGVKGLVFLPWKAHLAIGIAAYVYRRIGLQLKANQVNWQDGRTITSNFAKIQSSCAAFTLLFSRLRKLPEHNINMHQHLLEKLNLL